MKKILFIPVVFIVVSLISINANASFLLGTYDFAWAGGTDGGGPVSIDVKLYEPGGDNFRLFLVGVHDGSDGAIFSLDSGSIFDRATSLVTNGRDEKRNISFGSQTVDGYFDWQFIGNFFSLDFRGASIDRFDLIINSPAYDDNSSILRGTATIAVSGTVAEVPIPAAVWLFGSGLLGLIGVARRNLVKLKEE